MIQGYVIYCDYCARVCKPLCDLPSRRFSEVIKLAGVHSGEFDGEPKVALWICFIICTNLQRYVSYSTVQYQTYCMLDECPGWCLSIRDYKRSPLKNICRSSYQKHDTFTMHFSNKCHALKNKFYFYKKTLFK